MKLIHNDNIFAIVTVAIFISIITTLFVLVYKSDARHRKNYNDALDRCVMNRELLEYGRKYYKNKYGQGFNANTHDDAILNDFNATCKNGERI